MPDIEKKILDGGDVVKAMGKLKLERVEVNINPKKHLYDFYKVEMEKLEKIDATSFEQKEKDMLVQMKTTYAEQIEKYAAAKMEAVMVPLKYKDLQVIKDGVLEAIKYGREFNWDDDIRMRAMVREEHTLTVYLSLRRKEDLTKRYYSSLEEIAKEPESTMDELYNMYFENFVLSDEERKNS